MKTEYKGFILVGVFVLANVGAIIWYFMVKKHLKECESVVSTNCPLYNCSNAPSGSKCGNRPWRCKDGKNDCSGNSDDMICMEAQS